MPNQLSLTLEGERCKSRGAPLGAARPVYRFLAAPERQNNTCLSSASARRFAGEALSGNLLTWLNGESARELGRNTEASRRRVCDLICNIHNALDAVKRWPSHVCMPSNRVAALEDELNARLSEYPTTTVASAYHDTIYFDQGAIAGRYPDGESLAIHSLIRIVQAGLFYRIVRCHCGRFFFARFSHQEFCSVQCRKHHHEHSDEYRAQRRKYMRRYYRLKLSGKVK
jgi:hypothetical protein